MYSQQQVQTFSKIFIGAETRYGLLTYHNKETGEKSCTEVKNKKIPIQEHLEGKNYLGLSPVNEKTLMCEWLGVDIDLYLEPTDICPKIFSLIGTQYFCFMTLIKNGE